MAGRELPPTSRFAADDGAPGPALAAAVAAFRAGTGSLPDVVVALARARVLVPVVAVEHDAPPADEPADPFAEARHASASVVAVAAPDGRTALPVFSGVASLTAWRADARPMPAEGPRAAAAALAEGWDLLVLDPPDPVVLPRPAVRALAAGTAWEPAVADGVVQVRVRDAVVRATAGAPGVVGADAVPGRRAEVAVVLTLRDGLSREGLDRVLADVGARLADEVADVVDSLELRVSGAGAAPARRAGS